ncbi:Uu.00g099790.m01.CDS01 [Anthostomella pinea]|uniref:Uu.00g099790.m01.CDS01 n=1 Tax=Anthostomella pinea TaxID=933095 RepID=A0AAI8VDU8_9PEZI|nr:Uu.00g099790.m01.CDS01 [Anthostomella pinea]
MDQTSVVPGPATDQQASDAVANPIPSSLKRPPDYAEELKGLTSDGEEDDQDAKSSPSSKKRKTEHDGSGSESEGLDDGEIVESDLPENPVEPHARPQPQTHDSVMHEAPQEVSEDGEIDSAVLDPEASGETRNTEALGETGEPRDLEAPKELGDPAPEELQEPQGSAASIQKDAKDQKPAPHGGFNRGIGLGSRTSFGKGPATLLPDKPPVMITKASTLHSSASSDNEDHAKETTQDSSDNQGESSTLSQETKKKKSRKDPKRSHEPISTFDASKKTWNFPTATSLRVDTSTNGAASEAAFWVGRVQPWITLLLQANFDDSDRVTDKVVRTGWELYITRKMGLLQGTKKQIASARIAAQEVMASLNKRDVERIISGARSQLKASYEPQEPEAEDQAMANGDGHDVTLGPNDEEELRQQQKYFPSADDPSQYCISCSGIGHRALECPQQSCRFCGSKSHNSFGCPTRRRCTKCRQVGHGIETCEEKLALAHDERGGCAFCSASHPDSLCPEIWRSYTPSEQERKKVKNIPAFCYTCGGQNHYGPECALPGRGDDVSGPTTWSQANRDLYVDPASTAVAMAWTDVDPNALLNGGSSAPPDFHIRGRATRKTHTYYISSDDSDEDLIHAPIHKPKARGEIRIASNIGGGAPRGRNGNGNGNGARRGRASDQSRRRQNERDFSPPPAPPRDLGRSSYGQANGASSSSSLWRPPLPPGPPPPLRNGSSGSGFQRPLTSAPPGSLPPRPQSFGAGGGPASGSRGGRGGRGGFRGGRGRGRGRGK